MAHKYVTWAFDQDIEGAGRKFILVALADCANGDGYAYPGQKSLAAMTGQSERTIRLHLEWLEEHGYVQRVERRRKDGTRTSDAYHLPPEDSTGKIRRLTPTGKIRRLQESAEHPDQNATLDPPTTGEIRRLSAPRSTGRFRRGHRQNLPVDTNQHSAPSSTTQTPDHQPAESAGHEPMNRQRTVTPPQPPQTNQPPEEEEAEGGWTGADRTQAKLGSSRNDTNSHLATYHQRAHRALIDFRRMHDKPVKDAQFTQWAKTILDNVRDHGEDPVIEALNATIDNFPSLTFPFAFYKAALAKVTQASASLTDTTPPPDTLAELITNAKEGRL